MVHKVCSIPKHSSHHKRGMHNNGHLYKTHRHTSVPPQTKLSSITLQIHYCVWPGIAVTSNLFGGQHIFKKNKTFGRSSGQSLLTTEWKYNTKLIEPTGCVGLKHSLQVRSNIMKRVPLVVTYHPRFHTWEKFSMTIYQLYMYQKK